MGHSSNIANYTSTDISEAYVRLQTKNEKILLVNLLEELNRTVKPIRYKQGEVVYSIPTDQFIRLQKDGTDVPGTRKLTPIEGGYIDLVEALITIAMNAEQFSDLFARKVLVAAFPNRDFTWTKKSEDVGVEI